MDLALAIIVVGDVAFAVVGVVVVDMPFYVRFQTVSRELWRGGTYRDSYGWQSKSCTTPRDQESKPCERSVGGGAAPYSCAPPSPPFIPGGLPPPPDTP